VAGGWRELHNGEFPNLYSSPSINRMMKSRRMRRAGRVARTELLGMRRDFYGKAKKKETTTKT
jgi:hypothetical protein